MRERASLAFYLVVVAAYVAVLLWGVAVLPEVVPNHVGPGGEVDGWSGRSEAIAFEVLLGFFVLLGLPAVIWLVSRGDGTGANIPHKNYWFAPENKPGFQRMFLADGLVLTALTGAVMAMANASMTWLAVRNEHALPTWLFPLVVGGYLVGTLGFTWHLVRTRYVPPEA